MDNAGYVIDCGKEIAISKEEKKQPTLAHTFEEAITLAQVGMFHYKLLLICGMCFMSVFVEMLAVSMIMPLLKCDLRPTMSERGILASSSFLGVVLSSHAVGFLADTWGRVLTLRYALLLGAVCSIISSFSVNIWMLIALRFLTGFFISGGQACVFSLCGEFHGNASRVRHVTLLSCFMCFAMIFAPSMAILIVPLQIDIHIFGLAYSSWRLLLLANVTIALLALIGMYTLPETPKYMLVQGNKQAALETLRRIYATNTGNAPEDFPVRDIKLPPRGANLTNVHGFKDAIKLIWHQTVLLFYRERCLHTINICLIQFAVYAVAQGFFMWLPTIINEMLLRSSSPAALCSTLGSMDIHMTNSSSLQAEYTMECTVQVDTLLYLLLITIGATFTVIFLIIAYTIDYIGKKNFLIIYMLLLVICLIGLHWTTEFALVIILLTMVSSIGNCGGIVATISMEFYPTHINAMAMCFIMMIGRLGAVIGSNLLAAYLFDNCDNVVWAVLDLVLVLCILVSFLPEKRRGRQCCST